MRLSVIVPAYNEEDNIGEVIEKIEGSVDIPHELVVVNDHSADKTAEIVFKLSSRYKNIKLVHNNLKRGFANALRTGFEHASTELLVPVMGDLCDDLATIKKMLAKADEGYDIICGCRYTRDGARLGGSRLKGFFSCFVGWTLHYLLWIPTHDVANAFKMYRKKVIENIVIRSAGLRYPWR
jgi:dolichol-phosphate mannosyltransferase